ncbi:MAG: FAD:protein FMN transferase [Granulosicoccus sp.]
MSEFNVVRRDSLWAGEFRSMASPCELLIDGGSRTHAEMLTGVAMQEAQRIEHTFSRYRNDNIVFRINSSAGKPIQVDVETARLLDFSEQCFKISDGLFDVTSGVLREAWKFDGSDNVPAQTQIEKLLPRVGWQRVKWQKQEFTLPEGMQIDFGGLGKEYAVDRVVTLLRERTNKSFLVNFGGDLHASGPPTETGAWQVGIEAVQGNAIVLANAAAEAASMLQLQRGAMTTSGDAQRFLFKEGVRYGHVLHPKTGWPVPGAPQSVTVAGNSCTEAGVLSTLALLHGKNAEHFLKEQKVSYWVQR